MNTFFIIFLLSNLSINKLQASLSLESHQGNLDQMQPTVIQKEEIEEPSETETFEKIFKDLKISENISNSQDKYIEFIYSKLESYHHMSSIFKQNCSSYNSSILIKLSNFKDSLGIESFLTPECFGKILDKDPNQISRLSFFSDKNRYLLMQSDILFEKIMNAFEKSSIELDSFVFTEKMCNHIIENKNNSILSSKRLPALSHCFNMFPMNPKIIDALISSETIFLESFNSFFTSYALLNFSDEISNIFYRNPMNRLFNLFLNWKKIIEFILKNKWENTIEKSKLKYLKLPYFLISTILYEEDSLKYKYHDLGLVEKFNKFPKEKIAEIRIILREIINLTSSFNMDEDYKINSFHELILFMNPNLSMKSKNSNSSMKITDFKMIRISSSIIKFNPERFGEFLECLKLTEMEKSELIGKLFDSIPNLLNYPIKSNILLYHLNFADLEKYFGENNPESTNRILKYINHLDSMPYYEANILAISSLFLIARPKLDSETEMKIESLFQKWIENNHFSYSEGIVSAMKLLNENSFSNCIPSKMLLSTKSCNKTKLLPKDLDEWFHSRISQLKSILIPWRENESDSRYGKIVTDNPQNFYNVFLKSPKWLSGNFDLDRPKIRKIGDLRSKFEIKVSSNIILKFLLSRVNRENQGRFEIKYKPLHVNASSIEKNVSISDDIMNEMLTFMNIFNYLAENGNKSYIGFSFQGNEIGPAPTGDYIHSIVKSIFIHNDRFGIVTDNNGIKLPALMVHSSLMRMLGSMIGQLIVYYNIIPDIQFDDSINDYIHDLSDENLEKIWENYSKVNSQIKGLNNAIKDNHDITDLIFNQSNDKLTLTDLKDSRPPLVYPILIHSNWGEMINEDEAKGINKFVTNEKAIEFFKNRIELFKNNLFDGLVAFREGLNLYIDMNMIRDQGRTFSELYAGKMPSKQEFIEKIFFNDNVNSFSLDKNENEIITQISLKDALKEFIMELKDGTGSDGRNDYKELLKRWLPSPNVANLTSLNPKVTMKETDLACITANYVKENLIDLGYSAKNHPSSTLDEKCIMNFPKFQTCFSQLNLVHYKTIDEFRAAMMMLIRSDEGFRANE